MQCIIIVVFRVIPPTLCTGAVSSGNKVKSVALGFLENTIIIQWYEYLCLCHFQPQYKSRNTIRDGAMCLCTLWKTGIGAHSLKQLLIKILDKKNMKQTLKLIWWKCLGLGCWWVLMFASYEEGLMHVNGVTKWVSYNDNVTDWIAWKYGTWYLGLDLDTL